MLSLSGMMGLVRTLERPAAAPDQSLELVVLLVQVAKFVDLARLVKT